MLRRVIVQQSDPPVPVQTPAEEGALHKSAVVVLELQSGKETTVVQEVIVVDFCVNRFADRVRLLRSPVTHVRARELVLGLLAPGTTGMRSFVSARFEGVDLGGLGGNAGEDGGAREE